MILELASSCGSQKFGCVNNSTSVVHASPVTQCGIIQETSFLRIVLCLKGAFDIVSIERMPWTNQE